MSVTNAKLTLIFFLLSVIKARGSSKLLLLLGDILGLFRGGFFGHSRARKDIDRIVVILGAVVLGDRPLHMAQGNDRCPWPSPVLRFISAHLVFHGVFVRALT